MIRRHRNVIDNLACRVMAPFIFMFAFYSLAHGHYSPGGGFQGGAIFAAGVMLMRLALGRTRTRSIVPIHLPPILGAIGLLIYAGTGLISVFRGGWFLDYSYLPLCISPADLRYYGIFFVEIGIALGVFGILFSIFDNLSRR